MEVDDGEIDENIKAVIINLEDEEERKRVKHVVVRATGIEISFKSIEKIGRKVNVKGDGSCGYHSLMAGLKSVGKKFRDNLQEFRYDLRQFAENQHLDQGTLESIYKPSLKYTQTVGKKNWLHLGYTGIVIAKLFDVLLYVYLKDTKGKDRTTTRTLVYRPDGTYTDIQDFWPIMGRDMDRTGDVVVRSVPFVSFKYTYTNTSKSFAITIPG